MISLHDRASIASALNLPLDDSLRALLEDRIRHYEASGILNLTHLLIIERADTERDIVAEIGLSPLVNPLDGVRYGSEGFRPWWDWLRQHDGWFELIITVGDSGFAFILLVQDADGVEPELLQLCLAHRDRS